MFDPENSHSPQVKLILEWDRGFEKRDLDFLAKPLHKEFRYTVHPRSLGRPEKTKEEWLEYIAGITNLWTDHKLTIHSITEAPGKVIIHVTSKSKTSLGNEKTRESIFIGHIVTDEDGSLKIEQVEDFIDSKAELGFNQAVAEARTKKQ